VPSARPCSIDVWRIALSPATDLDASFALLDAEEQVRAQRFRFPEHRRRFIVAHAAVRRILAQRLDSTPAAIEYVRNVHGKPFLKDRAAPVFSLSHSHELALCAVAGAGELGVDIEHCRELQHADLAQRFFSADEANALAALPADHQADGFFACWSRKEAYIKAKGLGLSLPLDAFAVSIDEEAVLRYSHHDPEDETRCRLWEVPVALGYRAALVYCGDAVVDYVCRDWT
jgi:4'-phosphopantetheinyl transferase